MPPRRATAEQYECAVKASRIENRCVTLQLCAANSSADVPQFKTCYGTVSDHLAELEKAYRHLQR